MTKPTGGLMPALVVVALLTSACATSPSQSPSVAPSEGPTVVPSVGPTPVAYKIEEVKISTVAAIPQIDFAKAPYTVPIQQAAILASGGYLYSWNEDGSIRPDLAEDFPTYSADRLTMTIKLRPDLVYSDGTPLEAEDVVVSFTRQKTKGEFAAGRFSSFDSAEAPDATTVAFHLNTPVDVQLQPDLLAMFVSIHPRDRVDDADYFQRPVSATQYVITDWVPGGPTMTLEANPLYWRGPPAIKRIILSASTDQVSRVLQVTTGAVDLAIDIAPGTIRDLPKEVTPKTLPIGGTFWIGFRTDAEGPLGDVRVRQAICLAVDRDAINERAFLGISKPVAAAASQYRTDWTYTPILPGEGQRDLSAARELLAATPYSGGFSFPLQTWGQRPGWKDAATVISENLAELGITATVEPVEDAVAIANLQGGTFDAQFSGGAGDNRTLLSVLFKEGGFWATATRFNIPAIGADVDALLGTADPAEAQRLTVKIQKDAWEQSASICPLNERAIVVATRLPSDLITLNSNMQLILVATLAS